MQTRDIKTAEQFGLLERCKAFEKEFLLRVPLWGFMEIVKKIKTERTKK